MKPQRKIYTAGATATLNWMTIPTLIGGMISVYLYARHLSNQEH